MQLTESAQSERSHLSHSSIGLRGVWAKSLGGVQSLPHGLPLWQRPPPPCVQAPYSLITNQTPMKDRQLPPSWELCFPYGSMKNPPCSPCTGTDQGTALLSNNFNGVFCFHVTVGLPLPRWLGSRVLLERERVVNAGMSGTCVHCYIMFFLVMFEIMVKIFKN